MQLSEAVQQFIARYITSVDQIEILLLLKQDPSREWTAESVARKLFTQAEPTGQRLVELALQGLLSEKTISSLRSYRYEPRTVELDRAVNQLAAEYPKYRVTVINLIFSKPIDKIRTFADAFRLRQDEDKEEK
jgi:hypothetical protein